MNRKEQIDKEVEKTLGLLGRKEQVECSPFFYTRLEARIRGLEETREGFVSRIFRPAFLRPALLTVIVLVNIVSAIVLYENGDYQARVRNEYLTAIADEYSWDGNGYSDILADE